MSTLLTLIVGHAILGNFKICQFDIEFTEVSKLQLKSGEQLKKRSWSLCGQICQQQTAALLIEV